jgi:hypothetical protein
MSYLLYNDYKRQIQSENLQQIISADPTILSAAERAATAEAISYLRQKYDVSNEFDETMVWSYTKTYNAGDRVYLDADNYNTSSTYNAHDLVLYLGNVYICVSTTTGTFAPSHWSLLGAQYDMFSAALPHAEFDYNGVYVVGDFVFWKNNSYKALVQTPLLSHDTGIQYYQYQNIPLRNVAPDDPTEGSVYWGNRTVYVVTAGTLPTNAAWNKVDNRDQQMVLYLIDMTLYHVHSRIAPRNIPDLRVKRYDDAINWLKMCAKGEITPNLPLIKPMQGNRIRFGGQIRNVNSY